MTTTLRRGIVHIRGYAPLNEYGFNCLTGEACAYGQRLLFDLSEEGASWYREFSGLPYDCTLADSMNAYVGDKPAVASVMMGRGEVDDLICFILFHVERCCKYYKLDNEYVGLRSLDGEAYRFYEEHYPGEGYTNPRAGRMPRAGSRNIHTFTGRSI